MHIDVFISYSKDKHIADAICTTLEKQGVKCCYAPRDMLPGKAWTDSIFDAIETCSLMVLVFSKNSNKSVQVVREVELAVRNNKIIIPFRIEDVVPSKSMQYLIGLHHWLDAFPFSQLNNSLERLVKSVKKNINFENEYLFEDLGIEQKIKRYYHTLAVNFLSKVNTQAIQIIKEIPENVDFVTDSHKKNDKSSVHNLIRELEILLQVNNKSKGEIPEIKAQVMCGTTDAMITIWHKDDSISRYTAKFLPNTDLNSSVFTKLSNALFLLGYDESNNSILAIWNFSDLGLRYNFYDEIESCVSNQISTTLENISKMLQKYPDNSIFFLYDLIENIFFKSLNEMISFEQNRCKKIFG